MIQEILNVLRDEIPFERPHGILRVACELVETPRYLAGAIEVLWRKHVRPEDGQVDLG